MPSPFSLRVRAAGFPATWRHNSESVVYQRDSASLTLQAIPEDVPEEVDNYREAQRLMARKQNWLLRLQDVMAIGVPKEGDQIIRTAGNVREVWQVCRDINGREAVPVDQDRNVWSVRSKLMKEEVV